MSATSAQEIRLHLALKGLVPTQEWLDNFLSTTRPSPGIRSTALFRLLSSNITETLQRSQASEFPPNILDGTIKSRVLKGPIIVQVLDVEDIGRSRWSQVEAIEAEEKGETTKGREIIRVVPGETTDDSGTSNTSYGSHGPHKLTLQDARGVLVYGMEMSKIEGVGVNSLAIGAKLLLKDVTVARAVLLLDPRCCQVLGGKIEALHKVWKEGRKERLKLQAQGLDAMDVDGD